MRVAAVQLNSNGDWSPNLQAAEPLVGAHRRPAACRWLRGAESLATMGAQA